MNKISEQSIQTLMEYEKGSALTLYVPTHRHPTPPHIQEDQIRFKNMVRDGCDQLADMTDEATAASIRDELESKASHLDFWQSMTETLAVFASKDGIEMYHLPVEVEERVHVGTSYDLAPLLILRDMDRPYYVLALAMQEPQLFKGDMYELEEIDIELPKSVEDALNIDEMFANSNTIRGHEGSGGLSHAIGPHGQGDSSEAGRDERMKYFRIIDQAIREHKSFDPKAPFIMAATESEAGDYQTLSEIPNMVKTFLHGNYLKETLHDLHQQAYAVVRDEVIGEQREALIEHYYEMIGSNKSSHDRVDIQEAARIGRVDTLMVSMFDTTADGVSDNDEQTLKIRYSDDYDKKGMLDLIKSVVMSGGKIIGMQADAMPKRSQVAAVYRY